MVNHEKHKNINWLQMIIIFILGMLIASNAFLLWNSFGLQREINKLKSDDLALAQAVNNLLAEVFSNKTVPPAPLTPVLPEK